MIIVIPLPESISTNVYYRKHYRVQHKINDMFFLAVKDAVTKQKIQPIKTYPIALDFTFYQTRTIDWANTSSMAKLIEDGLRHSGIIKDDNKKHVHEGTTRSEKTEEKPYCKLVIKTL